MNNLLECFTDKQIKIISQNNIVILGVRLLTFNIFRSENHCYHFANIFKYILQQNIDVFFIYTCF